MAERDLWWEARQKGAAWKPNLLVQLAGRVQSLAGQPAQPVYTLNPLIREGCAIVVDLNKYRRGYNLKAMYDLGVNRFMLRIGGPACWQAGNWQWQEDASYREYMDQLAGLGLTEKTLGYIVHCSGATVEAPDSNMDHTQLLDTWTSGGYLPGAFVYDDEVYEWANGAGAAVRNTPVNHVKSISWNTLATYKKFRRMVGVYTATWFLNKYPGLYAEYRDRFLDPINGTAEGMQRPMHYAWLPTVFTQTWAGAGEFVNALLTPTADQIAKYLQCGSYSAYALWQATFTFKLPGMSTGVDCSVSRGSLADYDAMYNLTGSTPPPPDDEPPDDDGELQALKARVEGLERELTWLKGHHHTTGEPL